MRPLLILLVSCLLPSFALAQSEFYLQLGTAPTQEEAETIYKQAIDEHEETLKDLAHVFKESPRGPAQKRFRVHAGPVSSRKEAQQTCATLRARGATCFVVETAMKRAPAKDVAKDAVPAAAAPPVETAPPAEAASSNSLWDIFGTSRPQPEAKPVAEPVAAPVKEEIKPITADDVPLPVKEKTTNINTVSVRDEREVAPNTPEIDVFGALFGTSSSKKEAAAPVVQPDPLPLAEVASAPQPVQPALSLSDSTVVAPQVTGSVEVAEAIPVPLSSDLIEDRLPALKVVEAPPSSILTPTKREPRKHVFVAPFTSGPVAMSCFDTMATAEPALRKLRARATTSFGAAGLPSAALRISNVPESLQERVCGLSKACGDALHCGAAKLPEIEPVAASAAEEASSSTAATSAQQGGFWGQLGSFPTYAHAQSRFEELRESQPDLLGNVEPTIRAPMSKRSHSFRLRIGPFSSQAVADQFCWKLAARGVDCLAISE